MAKELYSFKLKSHPDKLLKDHLLGVGNLCRQTLKSKKLSLDKYLDFEILLEVMYLIGASHDFGKATSYFQGYIAEKDESKKVKLKRNPRTHHGLFSAIFTYYIVKEYLLCKGLLETGYYKYLPVLSFLIVKKHHGDLKDAQDEIYSPSDDEKIKILKDQIKSIIDFDEVNMIFRLLFSETELNICLETFSDELENLCKKEISRKEKRLLRKIGNDDALFYYFITLLMYSTLLDSDKSDAIGVRSIEYDKDIPENIVDQYKILKHFGTEKKIDKIRNAIYEEVISKVGKISLKDRIFSLNVPTGTGKTLTSLSFALRLRRRIKNEMGYTPKIIYSLPFLSIIDQNYDVFEDLFNTVNRKKPTSDILLKHHHLSDIFYITRDDEFEVDESLFLIEGWNSEIVVTTFVQFFHSLISNKNKSIRKFHNIVNSVIILDEVQTIPHRYWHLLKETIEFLAERFNSYFILVTATQPLVFNEDKGEISQLIENKNYYFEQFNRIKLIPYLKPKKIADFKKILKQDLMDNRNKDFLIVLNTIDSSRQVYEFIESLDLKDTTSYYLSTNIIPKERLKRIREIKDEDNSNRRIIVSTQLIEAGVDIDVDIVYRDFAPLDSINQVAGRCNRNFSDYKGIVRLFRIIDDNNREYCRIYDTFLLSKTEDVLKEALKSSPEVDESSFLDLNNNYFEKVKDTSSEDISNCILNFMKKLDFEKIARGDEDDPYCKEEFKLIKDDYYKIDVFVELDKEAKEVWRQYREIRSIKDPFKRKEEFLKIKKNFYEYVISVPKEKAKDLIDENYEEYGICYVPLTEIENYYDPETGFKRDNAGSGTMIC